MVRALVVLILTGALGAGSVAAAAPSLAPKPSITIVRAKTSEEAIALEVRIRNWTMYPALVGKKRNRADGGHWHIYVDGKYNNLSAKPATRRTLALQPGFHKIAAALANDDHSPLRPPANSQAVTVEIRP